MNCWSPNAIAWQMTDCICPASLAILPGLVLKLFMAQDFLFVLFCFLLSFHLEANWNSWCIPSTSTSKIDIQHISRAKSLYSQQYSAIYKKCSNPKVLLEKIHHEEKFHGQRYSLTLRGRWDESYYWVKILISENKSFLLFFFWWLVFNLVIYVKEQQETLFQSNLLVNIFSCTALNLLFNREKFRLHFRYVGTKYGFSNYTLFEFH